ncbi:DUF2945 domain-containing protein [Haloferula rosea]|uniref:DUF2945 domain-containing protein n=1 Tax=Haloferula rosea TaxID=490093 RepID=A0A934RF63_9BACT|nr:DUF2945 domain-containing protein [Haloferula rosea]MBK1828508.1 DUF2945 domain-containing protein [Haloferula rosea]
MIREGTNVSWSWGNGTAKGEVTEVFHEKVTRTIDGNEVTRDASEEEPAYLIRQDDGAQVLKSASEVERSDAGE